jgi:hypothetical protein
MSMSLEGWGPAGIAAAVAIVAGIVLLVAYAVRRGLVHRELEGIENDESAAPASTPTRAVAPRAGRSLGIAGTALLVVGLALGLVSAIVGWGGSPAASGAPGTGPQDCSQSWNGCPQSSPRPSTQP